MIFGVDPRSFWQTDTNDNNKSLVSKAGGLKGGTTHIKLVARHIFYYTIFSYIEYRRRIYLCITVFLCLTMFLSNWLQKMFCEIIFSYIEYKSRIDYLDM